MKHLGSQETIQPYNFITTLSLVITCLLHMKRLNWFVIFLLPYCVDEISEQRLLEPFVSLEFSNIAHICLAKKKFAHNFSRFRILSNLILN